MKMGQTTTPEKTPVDWSKILTGATTLASSYLTFRASTRPGAAPTPAAAPQPTGMSNNTKTLLIGGGILVAGLLIYSLTKKK